MSCVFAETRLVAFFTDLLRATGSATFAVVVRAAFALFERVRPLSDLPVTVPAVLFFARRANPGVAERDGFPVEADFFLVAMRGS